LIIDEDFQNTMIRIKMTFQEDVMKFFIDTANIQEIKEGIMLGMLMESPPIRHSWQKKKKGSIKSFGTSLTSSMVRSVWRLSAWMPKDGPGGKETGKVGQ